MKPREVVVRGVGLLLAAALLGGCVGPMAAYTWKLPGDRAVLAKYRRILVDTRVGKGAISSQQASEGARRRIAESIKAELAGTGYLPVTPDQGGSETLEARVSVTRYDDGSGLARSTFSAEGKMRIDANVLLTDWQTKERLAEFEVTLTSEWENIRGEAPGLDELEPELARRIVAGIVKGEQ